MKQFHSQIDFALILVIGPEDIFHRAKIIVQSTQHFQMETLQVFGLSKSQLISQTNPHWIHAKIAYVLVPYPFLNFIVKSAISLAAKLKNFYKLTIVMNRAHSQIRKIPENNFHEILHFFQTKYNLYQWEVYLNNAVTIYKFILIHSSALFIFTPTGSGLTGLIFMHKNTVVLCAEADHIDNLFRGSAATFNIFYLVYRVPKGNHYTSDPLFLPIDQIERLSKTAFYALENHKWPN